MLFFKKTRQTPELGADVGAGDALRSRGVPTFMAGTQAAPDGTRATTRGCVTESGHVAPMGPRCVTPVLLEARTRRRARSAAVSAPVSMCGGRFATFFLTSFFFFLTLVSQG